MRAFPTRLASSRLARGLVAVPLLLAFVATPSVANNLTTINHKVSDASEALTQASKQVTAAAKRLKKTQAQLPLARAALADASAKEAAATGVYNQAVVDLATAKQNYANSLSKQTSKEAEISQLQIQVDQFARSVYQQGPTSQWEIVLQSQSPSDLTDRLQTIKAVSQTSANSLTELLAAKEQLKSDAQAAQTVRLDIQRVADIATQALIDSQHAADAAARAKASLDTMLAQQAVDLKIAQDDRAKVQKQFDELRAEQIRIAAAAKAAGKQGAVDPQATGPLSWPLPGYAPGGGVGWRIHPVYGYRSCHTGQDIPAPGGTPIHAAAAGVVLSTSVSIAYGNMTLIDHGGGMVTMYAHQSRFGVAPGERVRDQQVIGFVGTTGFSTGNHLHFEVHLNGVPYNPMGWFGGSKTVVPCWG